MQRLSDHEFQLGKMKLDANDKSLRIPATMRVLKGPLEYLLVSERGSAHESLFMTTVSAFEINVALLLLGFKECDGYFKKETPASFPTAVAKPKIAEESKFDVLVEWKTDAGELKTNRAEEWVYDFRSKGAVSNGPFVYTGSFINEQGQLAAQASANVIALYTEPAALGQNPRKNREFDDNWDSKPIPEVAVEGREVTIVLKRLSSTSVTEPSKTETPPAKKESDSVPKKPKTSKLSEPKKPSKSSP